MNIIRATGETFKFQGIYGRQCNQCQPGFWSFPDCRVCQCNDHANICDQKTGACIECKDLTTGHYCERCQDGYYGDPRYSSLPFLAIFLIFLDLE